jgi:hypothetical protein
VTVKEPRATEEERVAVPVGEAGVEREELPWDVRVEFWLETFPWFPAVSAGFAAFVLGYLGLFAVAVAGSLSLPQGNLPVRVGFLFYNAHNVVVTGITAALPNTIPLTMNYLPLVEHTLLYRFYPAVALTVTSALFTFFRVPIRRSMGAALATGVAMGTGYVLIALAGTFAFSLHVDNILYQPSRAGTFLYLLCYGLLCGVGGSLCGQAAVNAALRE